MANSVADVKVMNVANGAELTFEILDTDVCIANAIRRVLLTEVRSLVFRGFPHKDNCINITKNNTKFNNEYIKHRMQCIPIHVNDPSKFESIVQKYQLRLSMANNTNNLMYVTSEHFVLYAKGTDDPVPGSEKQIKKMFPPDAISAGYIPICCLRPRMTDTDEIEEIQMIIDFSIGTPKEDACWNMVTKCCFENKKDDARFDRLLKRDEATLREYFKTQADIDNYLKLSPEEMRDFEIIESQRVFLPNHYIMYVQSIGVYEAPYLITYATDYMVRRLDEFNSFLASATINTVCLKSENYCLSRDKTTLKPVITLFVKNDDYTVGKIIEKYLYYMNKDELFYVSFKKEHPHDTYSLVLFSYKDADITDSVIIDSLKMVADELTRIYKKIDGEFRRFAA